MVRKCLKHEGNFVWFRDSHDWKTYGEWRQDVFPQYFIGYYQMLLTKYFETRYLDKLKFKPIVIEFRDKRVAYIPDKHAGCFSISRDKLVASVNVLVL